MSWSALSLACFGAALALHALASRFGLIRPAIRRYIVIFGGAGVALLGAILFAGLPATEALAAVLAYGFLVELYLFMFTLSLGSVSVKILRLLRVTPLTRDEIEARYAPEQMVDIRLHRLVVSGFIVRSDDVFRLTRKGRSVRFAIDRVRGLLHHGRPGR
jgi:hypothetical protein